VALRESDGSLAWRTTMSPGGHFWASPIFEGGDLFVGLNADRGYLAKIDITSGGVVWMVPTTNVSGGGARIWASPLLPPGSGMVVVGTSPGSATAQPDTLDSVLAFDRATGALLWKHQLFPRDQNRDPPAPEAPLENRDISSTPHLLVLDGRPVVVAGEKNGPTWTLDLADGSLVHASHLVEPRAANLGSGGVADGVEVVSTTGPDRIAGFDVETGDLLWEQSLPSTNFAPVALGGGLAWVGDWDGQLRAYDLHTGRLVASLDAGGGVLGGASLAHGRVIVGSLTPSSGGFFASLGKLPGFVSAWSLS